MMESTQYACHCLTTKHVYICVYCVKARKTRTAYIIFRRAWKSVNARTVSTGDLSNQSESGINNNKEKENAWLAPDENVV